MPKKILVLLGNPNRESLCGALADRYAAAATQAGHEVRVLALSDVPVDLQWAGYRTGRPEADWVLKVQAEIAWSQHLVLVTPMWWGGPPAALKALLDRVLLPDFAFRYRDQGAPERLLSGRSARMIVTADSPGWWFVHLLKAPFLKLMRVQVLEFCGFKPVKHTLFPNVRKSSAQLRAAWLDMVAQLGASGA